MYVAPSSSYHYQCMNLKEGGDKDFFAQCDVLSTLIVKQNDDGMHIVMGTCTSCAFVFRNPWQRKVIFMFPARLGSTFGCRLMKLLSHWAHGVPVLPFCLLVPPHVSSLQ